MKYNNIIKGIFLGGISGFTWGLDTVLLGLVLGLNYFNENIKNIILIAIMGAFFHDFFSSCWLISYGKKNKKLKKIFTSLKTKGGFWIFMGSILGGPIGMSGYLIGIKYCGSAYTAMCTGIYPGIGALLAHFILKEKLYKRSWIGIFISIIGVVGLGYSPMNIVAFSKIYLGIIGILMCIIGWSMESVLVAYGLTFNEINPDIALTIRQIISSLFYGIILVIFCQKNDFKILTQGNIMIYFIIVGLTGTVSYLCWYKSIDIIGAARGTALNITYMFWTNVFQIIILKQDLSIKYIGFGVIVFIGAILVIGNPKDMLSLKGEIDESNIVSSRNGN